MKVLTEIEEITKRSEGYQKIPSDIDRIHYKIRGEGENRKLTFYTYNLVHRLVVSAFVWIVIILVNFLAFYYDRFYIGIIITVILLLLILTPMKVWMFDFETNKVYSIFKILWIPVTKKEYSKKSFWNSKIEIVVLMFAYLKQRVEDRVEKIPEMDNYYNNLEEMEEDANKAIMDSNYGFVHINFKLVQKRKALEVSDSLPKGKFSFLKTRKIKKYENPFEVIIRNFFTEKRLEFIKVFTEFFPLSKYYLDDDDGPKTHNKLRCSFSKTFK